MDENMTLMALLYRLVLGRDSFFYWDVMPALAEVQALHVAGAVGLTAVVIALLGRRLPDDRLLLGLEFAAVTAVAQFIFSLAWIHYSHWLLVVCHGGSSG